ncbi:uncharacterized protein Z520_03943 [Fonsecaea multimorphosa CBS 102226]|uniref:Myb-like domain-containing protein n=1 Tax=Fonsecaea multimorphosa CBS 102226 TaxID=1442371 RepID=A0A0D2K348_9EURO|nr:uncharacterized protein Z520_03943 [Fonsecaea multimorphosa CBS 102226]KIY00258.1 hypothetical protein Z520_03943 [Fonsecaea multimorphosa CBS 102226]OAL27094.1 hypothetical protein AYO22_03725 [Fonsecaea multimorphosa]
MDLDDSQDDTADATIITGLNNPSLEVTNVDIHDPGNVHALPFETATDIPEAKAFHHRKWDRLRKHYQDQYLEIFKETFETADEDSLGEELPPSQLGAVLWRTDEKTRLYDALCRKGRHELKTLSLLVGTKSEVEIKAYLDHLREQEADRQRFEAQPKNISHADIPAAVEIGCECEAVLDTAAAALSAFQEQYDATVGQNGNNLWFIDHNVAAELDKEADELEASGSTRDEESDDAMAPISERAVQAFHLSTFLVLSERFFMNGDAKSSESWQNLAEEGQRPALALDSVTLFYDLIVNFARRLIQASLFIAMSRVRAAASRDYQPGGLVRSDDVLAALDVLGVKRDSESFWIGLARRNGLRVVDDAHRKGVDGKAVMSYEKVEKMLSSRPRTRSGSRMSTVSTRSQSTLEETSDMEHVANNNIVARDPVVHDQSSADTSSSDADSEGSEANSLRGEDDGSSSEEPSTSRMSREKRIQFLEEDQDDYLERMDREARRREESRLLSLLGTQDIQEEKDSKEEAIEDLGVRPPVLRKSVEDCMGWSVTYEAEWERNGRMLLPESPSLAEPASKRRRLEPESDGGWEEAQASFPHSNQN